MRRSFLFSDNFKKGAKIQEAKQDGSRTIFRELCTAFGPEDFTSQPEQDDLLPVKRDSSPLCRITADGVVRYWQKDAATPEQERAREQATSLACTMRDFMALTEQAPSLKAHGMHQKHSGANPERNV